MNYVNAQSVDECISIVSSSSSSSSSISSRSSSSSSKVATLRASLSGYLSCRDRRLPETEVLSVAKVLTLSRYKSQLTKG